MPCQGKTLEPYKSIGKPLLWGKEERTVKKYQSNTKRKLKKMWARKLKPPAVIKTKEGFFEELVVKIEPEAYLLREVSVYTVVRPRTKNDPPAIVPRVLLSGIEYSPEAAWRSSFKKFCQELEIEIPAGATRGQVRKIVDNKIFAGTCTN